jgi:GntR family transcriptional regulator, transcriptional repressor for pyruvate dehydrogenase complex
MTKPRRATAPDAAAPAVFSPIKSGRKSDQVFDQISQLISVGRFSPGTRLPAERELSAMFNASRQTIREAIYRAELVGLIEVRHGSGSFVVADTPQVRAEKPILDLIKIEAGRVGEFFEIRRALEGWCASQAAKVGSKAHFAAMKAHLDAMRTLDVADDAWEENDIGFHKALASATGNPLAERIMDILRESFSAFYRLKRYMPNREEQKVIWQHHVDIYDAIRHRKPDQARAAIIGHMDFIEGKLAESVNNMGQHQE